MSSQKQTCDFGKRERVFVQVFRALREFLSLLAKREKVPATEANATFKRLQDEVRRRKTAST